MIIKEAEQKYGKEMTREIWDNFDLNNLQVTENYRGLDIADFEWDLIYNHLKQKDL